MTVTPEIVSGGATTLCNTLVPQNPSGYAYYSSVVCPSITNNAFAPGTYTLQFPQSFNPSAVSVLPQVFVVRLPSSTSTTTTVDTILQTTGATIPASTTFTTDYASSTTSVLVSSVGPSSTDTVFDYSTTTTATSTVSTTLDIGSTVTVTVGCSSSSTSTSTTSTTSTTPSTSPVSTDARCGAANGATCLGSTFGDCCR